MSAQDTQYESYSHNLDNDHGSSPKRRTNRKRKVLSCFPCRDRKMKCDRVYPTCGRCRKTERSGQCIYDSRLLDGPRSNGAANVGSADASLALSEHSAPESHHEDVSADHLHWKLRVQELKIAMLERKLGSKKSSKGQPHNQDNSPPELEIEEETMLRGKGFKTQFHGSTSVRSMIAHDRALESFTHEARNTDQSLACIRKDFKRFRDRKKAIKENEAKSFGIDAEVFAALPEKTVVDMHVSAYFLTWGTTYNILHEPSFNEEYQKFWKHTPGDYGQASFAAMLVLIVANTKCLASKDDVFVGDTTADREAASNLIKIYDSWMDRQSQKRLDLSFFQLQCMALLTKRVNCVQLKQDWIAAGGLVRLAIASGIHRDSSVLTGGKISEYEKEMKKRLWATIMELELQSSFESGLQSSLNDLYFDTPAPENLSEDALGPDSEQIPAGFPVETFTSASFLAVAARSLPLRVRLTQLLNSPAHEPDYDDILRYDTQLHTLLSSLPLWNDDSRSTMPSALLRLQLQQYLLVMHRPYAKLRPHNRRFMYSFTVCIEAASSMVSIHDDLVSKGILALNNLHNDMFRVGIVLSQVVYHNCALYDFFRPSKVSTTQSCSNTADRTTQYTDLSLAKNFTPSDSFTIAIFPQDSFPVRMLCVSSMDLLHRTNNIFEQKLMRLGTGYMEYWLLSAAISMLPPPLASFDQSKLILETVAANEERHSRCIKAVDMFLTMSSNVMSKQKNPIDRLTSNPRDLMESSLAAGTRIGTDFEATLVTIGNAQYLATSDLALGSHTAASMTGTFDGLQDTQLNLQDWGFPDFWEFDLAGHL